MTDAPDMTELVKSQWTELHVQMTNLHNALGYVQDPDDREFEEDCWQEAGSAASNVMEAAEALHEACMAEAKKREEAVEA